MWFKIIKDLVMKKFLLTITILSFSPILSGWNSQQVAAFVDYANTYSENERRRIEHNNARHQAFISRSSQPMSKSCYLKKDAISGMNKICIYDCMGSLYTKTVRSVNLCPLSL